MAWIEMDDSIWEHHKTVRLCSALGLSEVQVVGHLVSLWHFVMRNAWKDADLSPWGDLGIERAARWTGETGVFVKALRENGFMEGTEVHGWLERAGKLVQDRLYNEERRKNAVKRRKTDATQPYPTLHNPTQPNHIIVAHYIKTEFSEIYKTATQEQSARYYKTHEKAAHALLEAAGSLDIALAAYNAGRGILTQKKLSWTLDTIAKNAAEFVNMAMKEGVAHGAR